MGLDPRKTCHGQNVAAETEARPIQNQKPMEWKSIRRGWHFGGETLNERLLSNAEDDLVREHLHAPREERVTARAKTRERGIESDQLEGKRFEMQTQGRSGQGADRTPPAPRDDQVSGLDRLETRNGSWTYVSNLLWDARQRDKN